MTRVTNISRFIPMNTCRFEDKKKFNRWIKVATPWNICYNTKKKICIFPNLCIYDSLYLRIPLCSKIK